MGVTELDGIDVSADADSHLQKINEDSAAKSHATSPRSAVAALIASDDPALAAILSAWPHLPASVREAIFLLAKAAPS